MSSMMPLIPKLVFILILTAILFAAISLFDVVGKKQKVESEIGQLNKEQETLLERKNELANLLDYFQDPRFIEKEARRRLNFQKPGEKVVIIMDEKKSESRPILLEIDEKKNQAIKGKSLSNIFQWFYLIFKH